MQFPYLATGTMAAANGPRQTVSAALGQKGSRFVGECVPDIMDIVSAPVTACRPGLLVDKEIGCILPGPVGGPFTVVALLQTRETVKALKRERTGGKEFPNAPLPCAKEPLNGKGFGPFRPPAERSLLSDFHHERRPLPVTLSRNKSLARKLQSIGDDLSLAGGAGKGTSLGTEMTGLWQRRRRRLATGSIG
uniref:Uncharacterized protein n=1 Tax=Anopheles coluzzii TaxID=1518534 RepID=A0A8W7Q330_ANOCL